jgi:hypothetical protein
MGNHKVIKSIAAATSVLFLAGVAAAPAAMAYPPGNKVEVSTNKTKYKPKAKVKIKGSQLQPGCKVQFKIDGYNFTKKKVLTTSGRTLKTKLKGPKKPGKYKVYVKNFGPGCITESSKSTIRVKKPN